MIDKVQNSYKMQDSAKGTISGFIFQFEKALIMLSELQNLDDVVSIEQVDDIAAFHDEAVIIAIQAKHTISPHSSTFQDTSYALWRTLQIWIQKIDKGIFDDNTRFICCSNLDIDKDSLLFELSQKGDFDKKMIRLSQIMVNQEEKLIEIREKEKSRGNSVERVLKIIRYVIRKKRFLKIIIDNLEIKTEKNIKSDFLNRLYVGIDKYSHTQKDKIYHEFYGWLFDRSISKWRNGSNAIFSKREFDEKHFHVFFNSSITNLVFRTKNDLQSLFEIKEDIISEMQTELFVKQIEDIKRNPTAQVRIIKNAIIDFFYYDIELSHIITEGNYTKPDLDEFDEQCEKLWQSIFDQICIHSPDYYSEETKNDIAIQIFDNTMSDLRISFKDFVSFNQSNEYFKKGCLLKLSNIPKIGWHPNWEDKYKINNE